MTYTYLIRDELVMIESYYHQNIPVTKISKYLNRPRQTIYNVTNFILKGHTALDYYKQYKENKRCCGRRAIILPEQQQVYIKKKVADGWTLDVIIDREEKPIDCSTRTLYRQFKKRLFD